MPIVNLTTRDLTVQITGEHRGIAVATFADGRVVQRHVRAPDADAWAATLATLQAKIEESQADSDAQGAVSPDADVAASNEASLAKVAVAYLRRAWAEEDAYDAYLLFDRFNTYRVNQGWTLEQVQTNLAAEGLTIEEWDGMKTAYQYLAGAGRPTVMADNKTIQDNWEAR